MAACASSWPWPRLVVHRLAGTLAPENTLAALNLAARMGVRAVETDVMLTRDGVAVISHDPQLGRVVASDACVADLSLKQLRELDAGQRFGKEWAGEKIPLLTEVIETALRQHVFLNLEIKPSSEALAEATARETVRVVREMLPREAFPLLSSFSRNALLSAKNAAPELPRGLLLEGRVPDWEDAAQNLEVRTVHPDDSVSDDMIRRAKFHGWGIMCWTIDDVSQGRALLARGVDALCTNRPDRFLSASPRLF